MKHSSVWLLPDWRDSGAGSWLTWWESHRGYRRVRQDDARHPLRGDWMMRLEESLLAPGSAGDDEPVLLVAQGLGCHLAASWASHSSNLHRVAGALLVSPNDPLAPESAGLLHSWTRPPAGPLPFPTVALIGNTPAAAQARRFAQGWGSHIAACDEEHGEWPAGHRWLQELAAQLNKPAPLL